MPGNPTQQTTRIPLQACLLAGVRRAPAPPPTGNPAEPVTRGERSRHTRSTSTCTARPRAAPGEISAARDRRGRPATALVKLRPSRKPSIRLPEWTSTERRGRESTRYRSEAGAAAPLAGDSDSELLSRPGVVGAAQMHGKHQRVRSDCGRAFFLRPEDRWLAETTLGASRRSADRFSMQRCGRPRPATTRRLPQTRGGSVWPLSPARRRAARRVRRSGLRVRGRSRGGTCSRSRRSPRPFPSRPLGRGRRRHARRRP